MRGGKESKGRPKRQKGKGIGKKSGRKKGEHLVVVSASEVKLAAYKTVVKKMHAGKKLTAADYALIREVEAEERKAMAADRAAKEREAGKGGDVLHTGGATIDEDVREWIVRDGVVRGRVLRLSQVSSLHQVPMDKLEKIVWQIQRELLETYGFEGAKKSGKLDGVERQAFQWVLSIAQLSAISQEWELQMEHVRNCRTDGKGSDIETFQALVGTMKDLVNQRNSLMIKVRELSAKEKRAGTARGAKATSFAIVVKNSKL